MRAYAAVLACILSVVSVQASAQRYMMRERIQGVPTVATAPAKPAVKCAALVPKKYAPAANSSTGRRLGAAATSAAAITLCQAEGANSGPGVCEWDSMDKQARYAPGSNYIPDYPDSYLSAAYCG